MDIQLTMVEMIDVINRFMPRRIRVRTIVPISNGERTCETNFLVNGTYIVFWPLRVRWSIKIGMELVLCEVHSVFTKKCVNIILGDIAIPFVSAFVSVKKMKTRLIERISAAVEKLSFCRLEGNVVEISFPMLRPSFLHSRNFLRLDGDGLEVSL